MFFASPVLLAMISAAGIEPSRLNETMNVRIKRRRPGAEMRPDDHFPRMMSKATGTRVRCVRRRNLHFFLEFERNGAFYTERSRDSCDFMFPGMLPATAQIASIGKRLDQVLCLGVLHPLLGDRVIASPCDAFDGATAFDLTQAALAKVRLKRRPPAHGATGRWGRIHCETGGSSNQGRGTEGAPRF